jgi:hypothetical protein
VLTSITSKSQSAIPTNNKTVDIDGNEVIMQQDGSNGVEVNSLKAEELEGKMETWKTQTVPGKNGTQLPFTDVVGLKKLAASGSTYGNLSNAELKTKIAEYESLERASQYNKIQTQEADAYARGNLNKNTKDALDGKMLEQNAATNVTALATNSNIPRDEVKNILGEIYTMYDSDQLGSGKSTISSIESYMQIMDEQGVTKFSDLPEQYKSLTTPEVTKKIGNIIDRTSTESLKTLLTEITPNNAKFKNVFTKTKQAKEDYASEQKKFYKGKAVINYDIESQNYPIIYGTDGEVDEKKSNRTMDEIALAVSGDTNWMDIKATGLGTKDAVSFREWATEEYGEDFVIDTIIHKDTDKNGQRDVRYVASSPNGPALKIKVKTKKEGKDNEFTSKGTKDIIIPIKEYLKFSGKTVEEVFGKSVAVDNSMWEFKSSGVSKGIPNDPVKGFQWIEEGGTVKAIIGGKIFPKKEAKSYLYKTI